MAATWPTRDLCLLFFLRFSPEAWVRVRRAPPLQGVRCAAVSWLVPGANHSAFDRGH